jgi:hypothetical protein
MLPLLLEKLPNNQPTLPKPQQPKPMTVTIPIWLLFVGGAAITVTLALACFGALALRYLRSIKLQ